MSHVIGKSGQSINRLEDDRLLKGKGRFIDNLNFKEQAYLHIARSYCANAKINIPVRGYISCVLGCPYQGNVAIEDVVFMLHGMDIETGIDLNKLIETGRFISGVLGRVPQSRVSAAT